MTETPIGLTASEARRLLQTGGPNAIVDVAQHFLRRAANKLWAPVPWMLEAAIRGEAIELRRRGFDRQASELFCEAYRLWRYIDAL